MAHTLTIIGSDLVVTVNGNSVTSPYTLQNNDAISVDLYSKGEVITVNGEVVKDGTRLNLQDTDIELGQTLGDDARPSITILYTESGGGQDMSETWVLDKLEYGRALVCNFTDLSFISNNESYNSIKVTFAMDGNRLYYDDKYVVFIQDDGYVQWQVLPPVYQSITFSTPPTGDLLTWLQTYATKQIATVNYIISETELITIADSIRTKTSSSDKLTPSAMAEKIKTIPIITDISDAATLTAKLTEGNIGNFYRYTGTATSDYATGAIYQVTQV